MNKSLTTTQKITFSAMLLAMAVVSTFVAKTIPMGPFYYLRFSLTPALVIYTSLSLGPLYGAIVGAAADLIPAFALPTGTGDWNFLITLVYVVRYWKRARKALAPPIHRLGSASWTRENPSPRPLRFAAGRPWKGPPRRPAAPPDRADGGGPRRRCATNRLPAALA